MVQRIVVATDRSVTAERAGVWAGEMAKRFAAELLLVEVIVPDAEGDPDVSQGNVETTQRELESLAVSLAGPTARARVVVDESPADAIVDVARDENADVIVVGNAGMSGNKKFLLSNVPNRITHAAHCTVITVNTTADGTTSTPTAVRPHRHAEDEPQDDPLLSGRAAYIARVAAKHGLAEVFSRRKGESSEEATRESAKRLRAALEELGPTFCKLGQILSTRPDLVPPAFVEELSQLRDNVPQLTEEQVVAVMEEELRVPWDDVFDSIDPTPLATGSIAQVHRATLATGERVVVKVQRPGARDDITRDLGLLGLFARRSASRPGLRQVMDPSVVVGHLSESLQMELDFRREAQSIERMREVLAPYPHLGAPAVYTDFSTERLLVMEEIPGGPLSTAPEGPDRSAAAHELIESYYRQILTEGFFHADPHPGNLMWSDGVVYFLDFGMVGEVGPDLREGLVLLLLAFWQEDPEFLADTLLMLSGDEPHPDLDLPKFQHDLGALVAKYRHVPLRELQLGPMLQDVTALAVRYEVPLPPTLVLTAKALAQIQHATAELDPDVDPFAIAGQYLAKSTMDKLRGAGRPQELLYQGQKLKVRVTRLFEALERLVGARPGPNLQVQFRGLEVIETSVRRASRRIALALTAAGAFIGTGITATSDNIAGWVAPTFGAIAGLLTVVLLADTFRRNK